MTMMSKFLCLRELAQCNSSSHKGYDSEDNHVLVRDVLHALSVIPARYEHVPIRKTHGRFRKQMKRGYSQLLLQINETRMKPSFQ